MPQVRSVGNRNLPAGLRNRNGYYSWRHPVTGKEWGLGRDRGSAVAQAVEANIDLLGLTAKVRLVDRISGVEVRTFGAWLDVYEKQLAKRKLAENTIRTNRSRLKQARARIGGDTMIERVSTKAVADMLDAIRDEGKERSAQAMRSFLSDVFRAAVAAGWVGVNPVLVTESISVEVQRARLTLDVYRAVYDRAGTWLRNAMDLALVTAQRREDVAHARFADFRKDPETNEDTWFCEQGKTGNRVCIPMALRLEVVGLSLGDVVKRCRGGGVLSKHLVHQTRPKGNSPVGRPIWVDTITKRFSDALGKLGLSFEGKTAPTFHEIRSLAERLYSAQGNVNTQELLGHKDPRMTQTYHDSRGAEWTRIRIGGAKG